MHTDGLLPVRYPPPAWSGIKCPKDLKVDAEGHLVETEIWRAHEVCANIVPETWVEEVEGKMMVFGVDSIVRDRWNLVRDPFLFFIVEAMLTSSHCLEMRGLLENCP